MKSGIASGFIAGLVAGIVGIFSALIIFKIGFAYWYIPQPPITPITKIAATEIAINIVWGIIYALIYSKFYDAIPGKGVSKGLVYGLIIYLILSIRTGVIVMVHGYTLGGIGAFFRFSPIIYGLMLGILFEKTSRPISKYDVKSGIHPGAIAGLFGGIGAFLAIVIGATLGFWEPYPAPPIIEVAALMAQDMGWGAIFGILYVMFYDRIPGKRIMKGLYFSLLIFLMVNIRDTVQFLAYGQPEAAGQWFFAILHFIIYGPILGLLYRKPMK